MRTLLLSSVFCLIFLTCNKEEPVIVDCNELYSLDVALPTISQPLIWLNDVDDDVVFEDGATAVGGATYFLNAAMACEENYTLSVRGIERVNLPGTGLTERILVQQIGAVGQGRGIRLAAIPGIFPSSSSPHTFINLAIFTNAPEVDSVIVMGVPAGQMTTSTRFSYVYEEEAERLRITFRPFEADNTKGLLAVRLAATGEWVGREVDLLSFTTLIPFTGFEPLEYKTFALNLPADITDYQLRVSWLKNNTSPSSVLIGDFEDASLVNLLVPISGNGFLVRTIIPDEVTYLNQQYFEQWPTEVNVLPRYFLEEASLSYPVVSIYANDGDVVFLENDYVTSEADGRHWKRQYITPFEPVFTPIKIVEPSNYDTPGNYDFGWTDSNYRDSFGEEMEVSIYDYPLLSGGYQGFLRDAFQISNNQEGWLRTQVYEAVKQRITD